MTGRDCCWSSMCPETAVRETARPTLRPRRLLTRHERPGRRSHGAPSRRANGPASTSALARRVHPSTASRLMRHRPSAASASPRVLAARTCRWWSDSASASLAYSLPSRPQRAHQGIPLDQLAEVPGLGDEGPGQRRAVHGDRDGHRGLPGLVDRPDQLPENGIDVMFGHEMPPWVVMAGCPPTRSRPTHTSPAREPAGRSEVRGVWHWTRYFRRNPAGQPASAAGR